MMKTPENLNVGDLFYKRGIPFVIPPYQRSYDWKSEDVEDFTRDIFRLYSIRVEGQSPRQHFFGGIVCVEKQVLYTTAGRQFDVVDGQQRLATFTLLLTMINASLNALANQQSALQSNARLMMDKISNLLQFQDIVNGTVQLLPRLHLSKADNIFFSNLKSNIPCIATRESHNKLIAAQRVIKRELIDPIMEDTNTSSDEKIQLLIHLTNAVTEDCIVILITSSDSKEAYQYFMVLNDRGKGLGPGDLLRAHTLEQLEGYPPCQTSAEDNWDVILGNKEEIIEDFLRAYYPSITGIRAGRSTLFDEYRDLYWMNVVTNAAEAQQSMNRILELRAESEVYNLLRAGEWPYENTTVCDWDKDRLRRLINSLGHTLCLPLLLAASRNLHDTEFAQIVNWLDRFVFRYIIVCSGHTGALTNIYYDHCKHIREGNGYSIDSLFAELQTLERNAAPDTVFEPNLVQKITYSASSAKKRNYLKHLLTTIEDYRDWYDQGAIGLATANKMYVYDLQLIHLEHIYPQTPEAAHVDHSLDVVKHNLGNITFWEAAINVSVGNSPFNDKKQNYATSRVKFNKELAVLSNWAIHEFQHRQDSIVDMAKKVFSLL